MMMRKFGAVAVAGLALAICGEANAFHRCGHERSECYEKVRSPDVYKTVERQVVVAPGRREVITDPAVTMRRTESVVVAPARTVQQHVPAAYGSVMRRELVSPGSVSYVSTPAVTRTVHNTVVVRPGGYRWEYSRGHDGRERKCRVAIAPVTRTVARQEVVVPAGRRAVYQPAVYRDVARPIVLREASTRTVYIPAEQRLVDRTIVLRPPQSRIVEHAPVVRTERHQVLVRQGGSHWQPVR